MNLNLFRYQIRSKWRSLLYFSIGLFAYGFLITAIYPSISGLQAFSDYWQQIPEGFKNLFGGADVNILKPEGFITMEYYQMMLVIILAAFALGFTAFCVVKARENGTLEFILAHPVERWKYALTSFLSFSMALAGLCIIAVVTIIVVSPLFGAGVSLAGQLKVLALLWLMLLSLGSICLFASTALNSPGQVYAVGITVLTASYLINYLAHTWSFMRIVDYAFLYHYYDPYGTLTAPGFPWSSLIYYGLVSIAFATLSMLVLRRRDIAI